MGKTAIGLLAAIAVSAAVPALADSGAYGGIGLGYSKMLSASSSSSPIESDVYTPVIGLTVGVRKDLKKGFAAAELDADYSRRAQFSYNATKCSAGAAASYYCVHDLTLRLRGIYGLPVKPGMDVIGSLGYGVMTGSGATGPSGTTDMGASAGLTFGAGVQIQVGYDTLRIEVLRDNFMNTVQKPASTSGTLFTPTFQATTLKVTLMTMF